MGRHLGRTGHRGGVARRFPGMACCHYFTYRWKIQRFLLRKPVKGDSACAIFYQHATLPTCDLYEVENRCLCRILPTCDFYEVGIGWERGRSYQPNMRPLRGRGPVLVPYSTNMRLLRSRDRLGTGTVLPTQHATSTRSGTGACAVFYQHATSPKSGSVGNGDGPTNMRPPRSGDWLTY